MAWQVGRRAGTALAGSGCWAGAIPQIPLGVSAIVRRGWGDVKKKQRRSCEPRATRREAASCKPGRSFEPRAASCELRAKRRSRKLQAPSHKLGRSCEPGGERPQGARRQLRAGSGAQLSSYGLRITHHLPDLDRHASCVTRHQEPTCWPRRASLGVRGSVAGVRGEGVQGLGGGGGPGGWDVWERRRDLASGRGEASAVPVRPPFALFRRLRGCSWGGPRVPAAYAAGYVLSPLRGSWRSCQQVPPCRAIALRSPEAGVVLIP